MARLEEVLQGTADPTATPSAPIVPGQLVTGPLFNEPMRIETVLANGPTAWVVDCLLASPPVAATNATGCEGGDIPDALEIPAGWDSGLVHVEKAITCSVSLSRSDFIYSGQ
jgi:hypothetical protein